MLTLSATFLAHDDFPFVSGHPRKVTCRKKAMEVMKGEDGGGGVGGRDEHKKEQEDVVEKTEMLDIQW